MDNLKLLDILPNGVILFKDKKIEYLNQHILNVLNIDFLDKKSAIEIVLKTLKVKNEKALFRFFTTHNYFINNKKTIQIARNKYGEYDIFSLMMICPLLISTEFIKKKKRESQAVNIDNKVAKYFKINDIKKVMVLTFYKGLPLKNFGDIIKITKNSIEISVDLKHRISLLEGDDILLLSNTKKGSSILHGHVAQNKGNIFTIKNFILSKSDKHLREGIRIKASQGMYALVDKQKFSIYDISQKGISIYISDPIEELILKKKTSISILLNDEQLHIDVKYLKTIYHETGKELKIIFTIFATNSGDSKIHDYINKKQNEIIREIHRYQTNNYYAEDI